MKPVDPHAHAAVVDEGRKVLHRRRRVRQQRVERPGPRTLGFKFFMTDDHKRKVRVGQCLADVPVVVARYLSDELRPAPGVEHHV